MNWNRPVALDVRIVRLGLRSDSTLAVASRYWKLVPVAWAALRMAPVTGLEPTGVLASTAMDGLRFRGARILPRVNDYGKRDVNGGTKGGRQWLSKPWCATSAAASISTISSSATFTSIRSRAP